MNNDPITCSGNDLAAVCADIRLRGGRIEAMDVIGRAKYRVSYFYRVAEESQSARVRDPDTGHAGPVSVPNFERGDRTIESNDSTKDKQQAFENHFGKVATVRGLLLSDAGSARNAMTRKPSSVCAEPAALYSSIEDRMAALQSNLLSRGKIKRSKPKTMPDNYRSPYAD